MILQNISKDYLVNGTVMRIKPNPPKEVRERQKEGLREV